MKLSLFFALLSLSACSRDHGGIMTSPSHVPAPPSACTQTAEGGQIKTVCPNGITGTLTPNTPIIIPVTSEPMPVPMPPVNDEPGQAPGQNVGLIRTDLYSCGSVGKNLMSSPRFTAQIEVFSDYSRKYFVDVHLPMGIEESFVADEQSAEATPYSPISVKAGERQSSNVLHGVNEQTKLTLGMDENTNFKVNLRSNAQRPNIEMYVTTVNALTLTENTFGIQYGLCVRISD